MSDHSAVYVAFASRPVATCGSTASSASGTPAAQSLVTRCAWG